jgi:tRNA(fMet)-specific endonuclease VapC
MFVLDTDTITLLSYGNERVVQRVSQASRPVVTTVISRIELLQGRFAAVLTAEDGERLQRAQQLLDLTEGSLSRVPILPVNPEAANRFDQLRQVKGLRRIGRADLLIACLTLVNNATLVTRNLRHFQHVPGLQVENWAD